MNDVTLLATIIVILGGLALVAGIALLLCFPTMWLWNWLMPEIFGLQRINIWQALGLQLLSGFLIKSTKWK